MKFYTVVITAVFLCIISTVLRDSIYYTQKLEQTVRQEFVSYSAKRFVSQSFKNTCEGKGFNSLEQWKSVCQILFKLESIYYEESCVGENLLYAKWTGNKDYQKCNGEVYFKIQNGVENEL